MNDMSETGVGTSPSHILFPLEVSQKGVQTFVISMDEFDLIETGTKTKEVNGVKVPIAYYKFQRAIKK
jgi:hypothetical protein